jgi:hypothetical protein
MTDSLRLGVALVLLLGLSACGELQNPIARSIDDPVWRNPGLAKRDIDLYRVGDTWSRESVTENLLLSLPSHEQTWLKRTGRAVYRGGSGTVFIVGKLQDKWWALSNRHVFHSTSVCESATLRFPVLELAARCVRRMEAWNSHDLALIEIAFQDNKEPDSLPFLRLPNPPSQTLGDWIASAGFGVAGHTGSIPLTLNRDEDCRAFSSTAFDRIMGNEAVHSFAHGCDVSPGDSGSPIWERETGRWVGVVWSGIVPKGDLVQKSMDLLRWLILPEEDSQVWETLNFGVSLAATRSTWEKAQVDPATQPELSDVLKELLADPN